MSFENSLLPTIQEVFNNHHLYTYPKTPFWFVCLSNHQSSTGVKKCSAATTNKTHKKRIIRLYGVLGLLFKSQVLYIWFSNNHKLSNNKCHCYLFRPVLDAKEREFGSQQHCYHSGRITFPRVALSNLFVFPSYVHICSPFSCATQDHSVLLFLTRMIMSYKKNKQYLLNEQSSFLMLRVSYSAICCVYSLVHWCIFH